MGMGGFVTGVLIGFALGLVLTAAYMLWAFARPEFIENGWAAAWQMYAQIRKWNKLVDDYEKIVDGWQGLSAKQGEDITMLLKALERSNQILPEQTGEK